MIGTNKPRIFKPQDWQIPPWRDKSLICLIDGPAGTGKSHLGAQKLDAYMRKYPQAMGLMVRKTRESMTNSTLLFYDRQIVGDDPNVKLRKASKRFEYGNESIVAYGGMKDDAQREAIRSIGQNGALDFVLMEEAHLFTFADFEELIPRMRGLAAYNYYRGLGFDHEAAKARSWVQILVITNPDSDLHWIYTELIKGGMASRHFYAGRNIHNPDDYETNVLDKLRGVRRKRLKDGIWVAAEGLVYEDYRHEIHVVEPFAIPKEWRRFISIDFGFHNPFAAQWWAISPDDEMYLYRELYGIEKLVSDWGKDIKRLSEGETISFIVADPADAEGRSTLQKETGFAVLKANNEILAGVQAVQERLRVGKKGKPKLFLFNDALVRRDESLEAKKQPLCAMDEITAYVWEVAKDGKPNKERPVDMYNHALDALRYAVMAVYKAAKPNQKKRNPFYR